MDTLSWLVEVTVLILSSVAMDCSTGLVMIVHIAPTFGADDNRVAKTFGVPPLMMQDKDGNMRPMVDMTGKFYKLDQG